jgi:hypothetical protein
MVRHVILYLFGSNTSLLYTRFKIRVLRNRGIFRFKEIEGRERILKWLSSACVALTGIMWLSYEHAS